MVNVFNCQNSIRLDKKIIKLFTKRVLVFLKKSNYEVSLVFITKPKIKYINSQYRGVNKITDVISFGLYKNKGCAKKRLLGDIFICPAVAKENSKVFKNTLKQELFLYIIHGILHLVGYTDYTKKDYRDMSKYQQEILGAVYERK